MGNKLYFGTWLATFLAFSQLLVPLANCQEQPEESGSDIRFQSAAECLDMFAVLANRLSTEHMVAAYSKNVSSTDGASAASEWFEAVGSVDKAPVEYRVMRKMYGQGAWALFWDTEWQRTFRSGNDLYFSFGKYTRKMDKVPPPEPDETGKLLPVVNPTYHAPNILNATVRSWMTYLTNEDSEPALENWVNSRLVLYDKSTENGFVGFFYDGNEGAEIEFSEKSGFMPTRVRSFFREIESLNEETSERQFRKKKGEISTIWEADKLQTKRFLPVLIKNQVFSLNSKSHAGFEVEVGARWRIKVPSDMLNLTAAQDSSDGTGPLAEVQDTLQSELMKTRKPN